MSKGKASDSLSQESKTLITVLTLIIAFPIGLVLMWIWTRWPGWLKILITIAPLVIILLISSFLLLIFSLVSQSFRHNITPYPNQNVVGQNSSTVLPR